MLPKNLWKLTIDPRGKNDPSADTFQYCKNKSIIGIGWRLSSSPKDKNDATKLFRKDHKNSITAFNIIVHRMEMNDHAWVYGNSRYYVCNIISDWRHHDGGVWDDNDIHHVRDAIWKEVPIELVPGSVKRNLTMFGTAKKIASNYSMLKYSDWLFHNLLDVSSIQSSINTATISKKISGHNPSWLFDLIDAYETEDLVGLYLQKDKNWFMIKSSAYKSQREFECEYRRSMNGVGETSYMQVKSGHSITLDCNNYLKYIGSKNTYIYLFSTGDTPYHNIGIHNNIIPIDMVDIFNFTVSNVSLLPLPTLLKLSIA